MYKLRMSTSKLSSSLIDSCDKLYSKGVIGDTGLDKCKKLKEANILSDVTESEVEKFEKQLYTNTINNHNNKLMGDFLKKKKDVELVIKDFKNIELNKLYKRNIHNYSKLKQNNTETINKLNSDILESIEKVTNLSKSEFGPNHFKELVTNYKIIEKNREKEKKLFEDINYTKEKILHTDKKQSILEFMYNFNIFIMVLLVIIFSILLLVYFYKL